MLKEFIDKQTQINKLAKEELVRSLGALDLRMIISDRKKSRQLFVSSVLKFTDKFFSMSVKNGKDLKEQKVA